MDRGKLLVILLSFLPGDLFTNEALVVLCTLGSRAQIETRSLLDTSATRIAFINKTMARHVCNVLKIFFSSISKTQTTKKI